MIASASKVFPRPTLSAMMQPPKRFELVDRADHAVALKLEELLPDDRVADAGGRLDDALFVQFVATVVEEVEENRRDRSATAPCARTARECVQQAHSWLPEWRQRVPELFKPRTQDCAFFAGLADLNQAELVARCQTQTVRRKSTMPCQHTRGSRGVSRDGDKQLGAKASGLPEFGFVLKP